MKIQNAQISFEYPDNDEPEVRASVADLRTGTAFDLTAGDAAVTMWRAEVRDAVGWYQFVDGPDVLPSCEVNEDSDAVRFVLSWSGVPIPDGGGSINCQVRGELGADSDQVLMHASISIESTRYALWEFDFPFWQGVCPRGVERGDWYVFLPMVHGEIVRDPAHADRLKAQEFRETFGGEPEGWRVYPCGGTSMQYVTVVGPDAMLYLGTRDLAPERKMFALIANDKSEDLTARVTHYPALDGDGPREYSVPYPVSLSVGPGNWYAAGKIYGRWVEETRWAKPRSERSTARWFSEAPLWWLVFFTHDDDDIRRKTEEIEETVKKFPFPCAIHLYGWHQYAFDTLYPDYLPARPGVKEFIERCHSLGISVMPYINGRICDVNSQVGLEAEPYAVKDAGRLLPIRRRVPRIEHWPSKQKQYPMCPATSFWRDAVVNVCAAIVKELDVDGIYLDQVSACGANRCLDAHHGHPVGGGDFWVRGYETMMAEIRAACAGSGRELAFTSESNAETYAHVLDGFLTCNSTAPDTVPGSVSVHNRHCMTFGFSFPADSVSGRAGFAELLARQVLWGVQLGWFSDAVRSELLKPENSVVADMLADAVWVWTRLREFFYDGEMLDPASISYTKMGPEWIPGLVRAEDGPVHAAAWRLAEQHAVVLCNISDTVQEGTLRVELPVDMTGKSRDPERGDCSLKAGSLSYKLAPFSAIVCGS